MKIECPSCAASYTIADDKIGPNGRKVKCARCNDVWHVTRPSEDLDQDDIEALFASETAASVAMGGGGSVAAPQAVSQADPSGDPSGSSEKAANTSGDETGEAGTDFSAEFDAFKAALSDQPIADGADTGVADEPDTVVEGQRVKQPIEPKKKRAALKARQTSSPERRRKVLWNGGAIFLVLLFVALIVFLRKPLVTLSPDLASFYSTVGLDVNLRGLKIEAVRTRRDVNDGIAFLHVEGNIRNVTEDTVAIPFIRVALRGNHNAELYAWSIAPQSRSLPPGEWLSFKTSIPTPPPGAQSVEVRFTDEQFSEAGPRSQ